MNSKKIWLISITVGLLSTIIFSLLIQFNEKEKEVIAEEASSDEIQREVEEPTSRITIDQNKRAMSIPVTEVQAVTGFIEPLNRIDIISNSPINDKEIETILLVENLKVLAVGTETNVNTDSEQQDNVGEIYRTITVEVTQEEAIKLTSAIDKGTFTILLRNDIDK